MIVLLYALATVACGALAVRAPLADRDDPVRRAYALLAGCVALTWFGWTLYLIPGLGVGKLINGSAATLLPYALLNFVHRFFARADDPRDPRLSQLLGFAPVVALAYVATELLVPWRWGQAGPSDLLLGLWVFGGLAVSLRRLWALHQVSHQRVERARIRYLLALATSAIVSSASEALVRGAGDPAADNPSFFMREGSVQGAIPPLGALLTTTFLYFLFQVISAYRLLDLAEIFSRVGAVAIAAAMLVLVDSLSAVSLLGPYPTHGLFQAFVASMLFLLAWDPLRTQLERWLGGFFNPRGQVLDEALRGVEASLGRAISVPGLAATLIDPLVATGRAPSAGLYLWDDERRVYRLVHERGGVEHPAILAVARQPFVDGFVEGEPVYHRVDQERVARRDTKRAESIATRLRTMGDMNASLAVPFKSGDLVLGWLALADEPDSDGFSDEEIARLARLGTRVAVVLENIQSFDRLKEDHRLSALGTMAAGLAHEIRNPLAGIKGAAQFLESTRTGDDAEMVRVIVDETDRLNRIVSQFLDYARDLRVNAEPVGAAALVAATTRALHAQGLPRGVNVEALVDDDAPEVHADEPKIRQVLLNLAQNAVQAVGQSGTVRFRARRGALVGPRARGAACLEIDVEDTGAGIEPGDLDKLFVPFFTRRRDGTGLGLAISQRIVQAHQGEIDVRSRPGEGTCFTLRLPLAAG